MCDGECVDRMEEQTTMRACYYTKYGKPSVLKIGELPKAKIMAPDEILVKVHAAAINPVC